VNSNHQFFSVVLSIFLGLTIDDDIYLCYNEGDVTKPTGIAYITSLLAAFTVELLKFIWRCSSPFIIVIFLVGVVVMLHFNEFVFAWAYHGALARAFRTIFS